MTARSARCAAAFKRAGLSPVRRRLCERAWHLDPVGRRDRGRGGETAIRFGCREGVDVVDQVGDRSSAGRGRRGRVDLLDPGDTRQRRAADAQSEQSVGELPRYRSCAVEGARAADPRGSVEFFRIWRHQRFADLQRVSNKTFSVPAMRSIWLTIRIVRRSYGRHCRRGRHRRAPLYMPPAQLWGTRTGDPRPPRSSSPKAAAPKRLGGNCRTLAYRFAHWWMVEAAVHAVTGHRRSASCRRICLSSPGQSAARHVLRQIRESRTVVHRLTAPEGLSVAEILAVVNAEPALSGPGARPCRRRAASCRIPTTSRSAIRGPR